jgi:hypothetical protein
LSSIPLHTLQRQPRCLNTRENAARAAIESCIGRCFRIAEWQRERARLLEYAKILRSWGHKNQKGPTESW